MPAAILDIVVRIRINTVICILYVLCILYLNGQHVVAMLQSKAQSARHIRAAKESTCREHISAPRPGAGRRLSEMHGMALSASARQSRQKMGPQYSSRPPPSRAGHRRRPTRKARRACGIGHVWRPGVRGMAQRCSRHGGGSRSSGARAWRKCTCTHRSTPPPCCHGRRVEVVGVLVLSA